MATKLLLVCLCTLLFALTSAQTVSTTDTEAFEDALTNESLYAATDFTEELNDLADLDMDDDDDDLSPVDHKSQPAIPARTRRAIAKKTIQLWNSRYNSYIKRVQKYAVFLASRYRKQGVFGKGSLGASRERRFKARVYSVGRNRILRTRRSFMSVVRSRMTAYYRRYKKIRTPALPRVPTMPTIKKPSYGPKPIPSSVRKRINSKVSQLWSARYNSYLKRVQRYAVFLAGRYRKQGVFGKGTVGANRERRFKARVYSIGRSRILRSKKLFVRVVRSRLNAYYRKYNKIGKVKLPTVPTLPKIKKPSYPPGPQPGSNTAAKKINKRVTELWNRRYRNYRVLVQRFAITLANRYRRQGVFGKGTVGANRERRFKARVYSVGRSKILRTKKSFLRVVRSRMFAYYRTYKKIKDPKLPAMPTMPTIKKPSYGPKPIPSTVTRTINRRVGSLWNSRYNSYIKRVQKYAVFLASRYRKQGVFGKGSLGASRERRFKARVYSVGRNRILRTRRSFMSVVRGRMTAYYRMYKKIRTPALPRVPPMPTIKKPSYGPKPIPTTVSRKINRRVVYLWGVRYNSYVKRVERYAMVLATRYRRQGVFGKGTVGANRERRFKARVYSVGRKKVGRTRNYFGKVVRSRMIAYYRRYKKVKDPKLPAMPAMPKIKKPSYSTGPKPIPSSVSRRINTRVSQLWGSRYRHYLRSVQRHAAVLANRYRKQGLFGKGRAGARREQQFRARVYSVGRRKILGTRKSFMRAVRNRMISYYRRYKTIRTPTLPRMPTMPTIKKPEAPKDTVEGQDDNKPKTCYCKAMRGRKSQCYHIFNERKRLCRSRPCGATYQCTSKSASGGRRCVQRIISMRVVKDEANAGLCKRVAVKGKGASIWMPY